MIKAKAVIYLFLVFITIAGPPPVKAQGGGCPAEPTTGIIPPEYVRDQVRAVVQLSEPVAETLDPVARGVFAEQTATLQVNANERVILLTSCADDMAELSLLSTQQIVRIDYRDASRTKIVNRPAVDLTSLMRPGENRVELRLQDVTPSAASASRFVIWLLPKSALLPADLAVVQAEAIEALLPNPAPSPEPQITAQTTADKCGPVIVAIAEGIALVKHESDACRGVATFTPTVTPMAEPTKTATALPYLTATATPSPVISTEGPLQTALSGLISLPPRILVVLALFVLFMVDLIALLIIRRLRLTGVLVITKEGQTWTTTDLYRYGRRATLGRKGQIRLEDDEDNPTIPDIAATLITQRDADGNVLVLWQPMAEDSETAPYQLTHGHMEEIGPYRITYKNFSQVTTNQAIEGGIWHEFEL